MSDYTKSIYKDYKMLHKVFSQMTAGEILSMISFMEELEEKQRRALENDLNK